MRRFFWLRTLVIAFIGPQDPVGSYLMLITAPLLAALACVRRDSHQAACKWRTLGAAVGLFSLALLALLYRNVAGLACADDRLSTDPVCVLPDPLDLRAAGWRERPCGGPRDHCPALAAVLPACAMAPLNTALWTQCLNTMSSMQNSLVFCFALIRFLAEDDPDRRDFSGL